MALSDDERKHVKQRLLVWVDWVTDGGSKMEYSPYLLDVVRFLLSDDI